MAMDGMVAAVTAFEREIDELAKVSGGYTRGGPTRGPGGDFAAVGTIGSSEWAAVCDAACTALAAFPTGCTRAVLVAEVNVFSCL